MSGAVYESLLADVYLFSVARRRVTEFNRLADRSAPVAFSVVE
jgi:hypothetical protein